MRPKITVYITCHNYARFLVEAVNSVFAQIEKDWELIIINDGSTDNSQEVIDQILKEKSNISVFSNATPKGLPYNANIVLENAKGKYIIRLDADDYFDESALLSMATFLDNNVKISLVYPNYVYVDESGKFLNVENRKIIGKEAGVLDLPAHGACTMVRKRVLKAVGGYDQCHNAQDGHEIWLKIIDRYKVANISTPLFYYRQHSVSLTRDESRVLNARKEIKEKIIKKNNSHIKPRIVGIIPAKNSYDEIPDLIDDKIAGFSLIDYTLKSAIESNVLDYILVTSDDQKVLDYCSNNYQGIYTNLRDMELSQSYVNLAQVSNNAVHNFEDNFNIFPDILVVLSVHSPLRNAEDIIESINTLLLYDVDSVTSVYEDYDLHLTHGKHGLKVLNNGIMNKVRLEREALYVDNGAIRTLWRDIVEKNDLFGNTLGHIVMPIERSDQISSEYKNRIIEQILLNKNG
jgi:glycosyltransferase involved in cell wall biosynthesis